MKLDDVLEGSEQLQKEPSKEDDLPYDSKTKNVNNFNNRGVATGVNALRTSHTQIYATNSNGSNTATGLTAGQTFTYGDDQD